jgi:hypothetical protein
MAKPKPPPYPKPPRPPAEPPRPQPGASMLCAALALAIMTAPPAHSRTPTAPISCCRIETMVECRRFRAFDRGHLAISRIYFRADAAFAMPEVYEFLEAERIKYAIRLPASQVLQSRIGYLLTRPRLTCTTSVARSDQKDSFANTENDGRPQHELR